MAEEAEAPLQEPPAEARVTWAATAPAEARAIWPQTGAEEAAETVSETGKSPILRAPEAGAHSAAVAVARTAMQRAPAASEDPPAWEDPEVEVEAVGVEAAAAGGGK